MNRFGFQKAFVGAPLQLVKRVEWERTLLGFFVLLLLTGPLVFLKIVSTSDTNIGSKKTHLEIVPQLALKSVYRFPKLTKTFGKINLKQLKRVKLEKINTQYVGRVPASMRPRAKDYLPVVFYLAEKYQIDPFWASAVMWTESHFRPAAESRVGARGLMQIMPGTKAHLLKLSRRRGWQLEKDNFGIEADELLNIELGVLYLKLLLKKFENNHVHATVAYNMGPARIRKRLKNNQPVGVKNRYLDNVRWAYYLLTKRAKNG